MDDLKLNKPSVQDILRAKKMLKMFGIITAVLGLCIYNIDKWYFSVATVICAFCSFYALGAIRLDTSEWMNL